MRLYHAAGVYVGTQADAKRLDKDFTQVEVPTDKDGLMAFLNRAKIAPQNAVGAPPVVTAPSPSVELTALLKWVQELHDSGDAGNLGVDSDPVILAARKAVETAPGKTFEYEGQLGIEDADDISDLLGGEPDAAPAPPVPPPMTAARVVSQIDTPGIEQIVEVIATSKGQSLRRLAGAVAVRFAELGK